MVKRGPTRAALWRAEIRGAARTHCRLLRAGVRTLGTLDYGVRETDRRTRALVERIAAETQCEVIWERVPGRERRPVLLAHLAHGDEGRRSVGELLAIRDAWRAGEVAGDAYHRALGRLYGYGREEVDRFVRGIAANRRAPTRTSPAP